MLSSGPELVSHTHIQHANDPNCINDAEPSPVPAQQLTDDLDEDNNPSDPNDESLPPFGEMTPPSISLIGVAAFKWLMNVGEEVYTINIQPTSDHLDIEAL